MQDIPKPDPKIIHGKKRKLFVGLNVKLLITFTLLFSMVFGGAYYWFYQFATDAVMNRLKEDLETLLTGVSSQIDGDQFQDMVQEAKSRDDGYTDDERYWEQARFLHQMQLIDPRASFYTYIRGDEANEVTFIGSSGALETPRYGVTFRQDIVYPAKDAKVILKGLDETTFYLTIYHDDFGDWISGYTPIRDSNGQIVGALGVDFLASYVLEVQQDVKNTLIPAFLLTYLLLFIMVYLISRVLTRPVKTLTRIAERIGEGDYDQDLTALTQARFSDEINTLASVFEIMVDKVEQREERLKRQVSELQILIDESQRREQVDEIVDTDFFRDLQQKARAMRAGLASRTAGAS